MKLIIGDVEIEALKNSDAMIIESIAELSLSNDESIDWILICHDKRDDLYAALAFFRRHKPYCLVPIFSSVACLDENISQWLDGYYVNAQQIGDCANKINSKLADIINFIDYEDEENLLLCYLFSRVEKTLDFILDIHVPHVVRYPLSEMYIADKEIALRSVLLLTSRGFLESIAIKDEIQSCPHCKNCLVTYKNTCPECHTVDIKKQRFLHCFSCGNAEPEFSFLKKDILICSRCNTKLRHIGIDYDRPLEEYVCSRQHAFIEPDVISHCLYCMKESLPSQLVSQKLSEYQLSNKGASHLISVDSVLEEQLKDKQGFFDSVYFSLFLDWMLSSCCRYEQISFSLLNLTITNDLELIERYGVVKTRQLYSEFFSYLRSQLRVTDVSARTDSESITIVFTQTDSSQAAYVKKNINKFIANSTSVNQVNIKLKVDVISSDEIQVEKYDAKLLLSELSARRFDD